MQNTSALWKSLWASGTARLETRAIIAGVVYTDISAPVINRALMQGGLSIGNAVSATCSFSVRNPGTIPKSAEVVIQKRLTDSTQASEWLTCGTFYISHRQRDPVSGMLALECYDALLKANADMPALMPWTTNGGEPMRTASGEMLYFNAHYPRTMSAVMKDIALILGGAIRIDPSTQIETGAVYTIDEIQHGTRIVDVLRKIAAANGGNWIMTPQNKLKLVPVISAAGADSATANVVDVDGVVGGIGVSNTGTITGIRYTADGEQQVVGSESGIVLDADVSATVAQALLTKLGGMTYQAYSLSGAVYDPAAELGDYIRAGAGGEVASVIYAETATLGPAYRGSVSAPEIGELADEYPYVGSNAQLLTMAQQYTDEAVQTFDNSMTQQEIFDRLTDGGAEQGIALEPATNPGPSASTPKRVVLNLDYARFGKLVADFIQGGTLTLGGLNNANGVLQILDASGNVIGTWDKDGVTINSGTIRGPEIYIGGSNNQYGKIVMLNALNKTGGEWGLDGISVGGDYYKDPYIALNYYNIDSQSSAHGARIELDTTASSYYEQFHLDIDVKNEIDIREAYDNAFTRFIEIDGCDIDGTGGQIVVYKPLSATSIYADTLSVYGEKRRIVNTDQYSDRLLYCYETPSPMFGDVGEGTIGEDGKCYVWLDPVFAQTITTTQYQVFLQRYGAGECTVAERRPGCFIVDGTPGMAFGWEIKAKQRDFDQRRLERNDEPFNVPTQTYGEDAAKHIEDIRKERESA